MKEPGRRQGSVSRGGAKQVVGGISGGSIINDMQAQALSIPCEKNKSIRETSCGVTVRRRISRRRNEWPKAKRHYTIVGECLNPRLNVLLRDPSQQPFSGKNGRSCPIRKFTSQPQSQSRSHTPSSTVPTPESKSAKARPKKKGGLQEMLARNRERQEQEPERTRDHQKDESMRMWCEQTGENEKSSRGYAAGRRANWTRGRGAYMVLTEHV